MGTMNGSLNWQRPLMLAALLALSPLQVLAQGRDLSAFSGIWMNDNTLDETLKRLGLNRLPPGERLPDALPSTPIGPQLLTPAYQAIYEQRRAAAARLAEGAESCEWVGMPQIMTYPYPFEILVTEGRLTMIFEVDSQVRRIFLDRDEHLPYDDLDPTYFGDSIAHWEGDTLVIDTVGFHEHTSLWGGLPHSDQMRIVERITWQGEDTIFNEITIMDELALVEPIQRTVQYSKRPDWRIREYSCLENNRDRPDESGQRAGGVVGN
jgi:hypothetical protein